MESLDDLYANTLDRAEALTDARLVEVLLMTNQHARALAQDEARKRYGGNMRGLPYTLQVEAALVESALSRFAPETLGDAFALLGEASTSA